MSAKKQASGGARLAAAGKRPVLLGLTPAQRDEIQSAAALDGRPMTQFFVYHALTAARKILKKSAISS